MAKQKPGNKGKNKRKRREPIVGLNGKAVPKREEWLYRNPVALAMVTEGLQQARDGQFVEGQDLSDVGN